MPKDQSAIAKRNAKAARLAYRHSQVFWFLHNRREELQQAHVAFKKSHAPLLWLIATYPLQVHFYGLKLGFQTGSDMVKELLRPCRSRTA